MSERGEWLKLGERRGSVLTDHDRASSPCRTCGRRAAVLFLLVRSEDRQQGDLILTLCGRCWGRIDKHVRRVGATDAGS